MDLKEDFVFTSVSGRVAQIHPDPFTPLDQLVGRWVGHGFNQIWRPFHGSQDRFLELNETNETLEFDLIPGDIPNRGLLQTDINLHGVRYLQQIQDAHVPGPNGKPSGIHVEPGLWLKTPPTTNPLEPTDTVARLANIPHGTSFVAQGTILPTINGAPPIAPASIVPFTIAPPHTPIQFPETNLGTPSNFRTPAADIPNVTQAMVNNPNIVLVNALAGQNVTSTSTLKVSTLPLNPPATGGGTSNIAFLQGAAGGPNALDAQVDAIFWIETVKDKNGKTFHQLQYTQTVLLNFNGLSWPHVSVATLVKQ
jgi:hypothetical protein